MITHKWIKIFLILTLVFKNSEQNLLNKQYAINLESENIEDASCSRISEDERFDCHPEDGASELSCGSRNCCWKFSEDIKIPSCYYRKNWKIYNYESIIIRENKNNILAYLKLHGRSTYKNDLKLVQIESTSIDAFTLRVKLFDASKKRYEPPWPIRSELEPFNGITSYELKINETAPGFSVYRKSNKIALFDSNGIGGFIFANQFLQMSSLLPSHNIYGLGQHRTHLKLSTNWQLLTFFSADQPVTENANLYGSQPFYFVIEDSGDCHGVLFLNSNAMDVILQPTPAITFRTIGGIFDIYFFMGPTPEDVMRQYANLIGKPFLPPYWSLGFHLSRLGYHTLEGTKQVWNRTKMAQIPFDTQWNDLDYMERRNDFTYDRERFKGLPEFIKELHEEGMHYIPLIDAGISGTEEQGSYPPLDEGLRRSIFIKENGTDLPFYGKVWNPITTVWPDFTNPETEEYYKEMMQIAHRNFEFDGAWIDMNEPSSFINGHFDGCPQNDLDNPQFVPHVAGRQLSRKTLCMNANQFLGYHYDLHNTYGIGQAAATNYALSKIRGKRPFIITRSTWIGLGFYAGAWTGDAYSSWHSLRMSIPEILSYTFYQIPMVGVDICGFDGDTTEALCNRWVQVGAFYPFARNHNSDDTIEQDPVAMGELVVNSTRKSLMIRYQLLPYLYTLFFRAHKFGETVARPLFFEFVNDPLTYNIDTQFLWGSSLMILPVLDAISDKNQKIESYIPHGKWYNYYTFNHLVSNGRNFTLQAPLDTIPLLIRGGRILPIQKPSLTTTASRKNDFGLLVALNDENIADGELYWDDGDSLDSIQENEYYWLNFSVHDNILCSKILNDGTLNEKMILGEIKIMGLNIENINSILVNNEKIEKVQFHYDKAKCCLFIKDLNLNLKKEFTLSWIDS